MLYREIKTRAGCGYLICSASDPKVAIRLSNFISFSGPVLHIKAQAILKHKIPPTSNPQKQMTSCCLFTVIILEWFKLSMSEAKSFDNIVANTVGVAQLNVKRYTLVIRHIIVGVQVGY
jgi:hypothetical protein